MMYRPIQKRERSGQSKFFALSSVFFSLLLLYLPAELQETPAYLIRTTVLKPFILAQEYLVQRRVHSIEVESLQIRVDSLLVVITSQATHKEENMRMKDLLGVAEKIPYGHTSSNIIRPGTPGSEGLFLLDVGSRQGVSVNAPVVLGEGLLGMVQDVQKSSAVGIDWTHFQFRASAMTRDGSVYGLVRSDPGGFREADRLLIDGIPFHQQLNFGTVLVTSGLGGVYPRGIPIGEVFAEAESSLGWRRSYWVTPFVTPGEAIHVVIISPVEDELDYKELWNFGVDSSGGSESNERVILTDSVGMN